jgi:hypothetical protein
VLVRIPSNTLPHRAPEVTAKTLPDLHSGRQLSGRHLSPDPVSLLSDNDTRPPG